MHTYRVKLSMVIWQLTDQNACITVKAFSAEDALTIVRTRLAYNNWRLELIQDVYCEEG